LKHWNVDNQYVILRVDFNVPIRNGVIQDDTRIVKSMTTIQELLDRKAKLIILSHLGRPLKETLADGSLDLGKFSLKPVAEKLSALLNRPVAFANDCGGPDTLAKREAMTRGSALLLENTRFQKEEEKGNAEFAQRLAALGSYFINDAFGAAHREHATTATIARYFDKDHKAFGHLMIREVENGQKVLKNPQKPCTAILGGAKVSDKILLIGNLMNFCDTLLIGGGMAFTFLRAMGFKTGRSLCEIDKLDLARDLMRQAVERNVNILLPLDHVCADHIDNPSSILQTIDPNVPDDLMGLDIGPKTRELYENTIRQSKTIIWNGPVGVFEKFSFAKGSESIAHAIAYATQNGAFSLIGGGDSAAAINQFGLSQQVSFVSTGGGAMLELLEGKILPGIEAISGE